MKYTIITICSVFVLAAAGNMFSSAHAETDTRSIDQFNGPTEQIDAFDVEDPAGTSGLAFDEYKTIVPQILSLWLVDADSDTLFEEITDGKVFDAGQLPDNLAVVAVANDDTESVAFGFNDIISYHIENIVPYALDGDNSGDYAPSDLPEGFHTVRARPYAADGASGSNGAEVLMTFGLFHEQDIYVDSPLDGHDSDPGDGRCLSAPNSGIDDFENPTAHGDSGSGTTVLSSADRFSGIAVETHNHQSARLAGVCTLRAAIEEANARPGPEHIDLPYFSEGYKLSLGQLEVTGGVTIHGTARPTIDAQKQSRIFLIKAGIVTLSNLRLTGGSLSAMYDSGGAVRITGASEVFIDQVIVEDNAAAPGGRGGGIYVDDGNLKVVEITDSVIRNNTASNAGVGGAGGVDGHAWFRIVDTLFEGNDGQAGGLFLRGANSLDGPPRHEIIRSTFRDNYDDNSGGGGGARISVDDEAVLVSNSTFSANSTSTIGGGLSVISGNVDIEHSTFSENVASNQGDALFVGSGSEVHLMNNLIAENGYFMSDSEVSCTGAAELILDGFNLINSIDENCDFLDASALDNDNTGPVDAGIMGYTEEQIFPGGTPKGFYSLDPLSEAIDHGPSGGGLADQLSNGPPLCLSSDQIGNPRPVDGDTNGEPRCDTGAIEYQGE